MIRRIHKFLKLTVADRWLLLQAFFLLAVIQLGLHALPFLKVRRLLDRCVSLPRVLPWLQRPAAERIPWAIQVARCYLTNATCLPQALATHFLLRRNGYPADLKIGAAKNAQGTLEAHAWVVSEQKIVIGALRDLDRYVPLSTANQQRS